MSRLALGASGDGRFPIRAALSCRSAHHSLVGELTNGRMVLREAVTCAASSPPQKRAVRLLTRSDFTSIVYGSWRHTHGMSWAHPVRAAPLRSWRGRGRSCIRSAQRRISWVRTFAMSRGRLTRPKFARPEVCARLKSWASRANARQDRSARDLTTRLDARWNRRTLIDTDDAFAPARRTREVTGGGYAVLAGFRNRSECYGNSGSIAVAPLT